MAKCAICGRESTGTRCPDCGASLGRPSERRAAVAPPSEQDAPGSQGLCEPWLFQPSKIGKRQPDTRAHSDQHFLVPPFGDPLRIEARAGAKLTLGREKGCDLTIASPTVSRHHAELSFRGDPLRTFIRDLGTVNGIKVNGVPVKGERELHDKDVVRLGEVTAVFRVLRKGEHEKTLHTPPPTVERLDATIPVKTSNLKAMKGLSGDIAFYPMDALLGRLTMLHATGNFTVDVDGAEGSIRFDDGKPSKAKFGGREGSAAFSTIVRLTRGEFRFDSD